MLAALHGGARVHGGKGRQGPHHARPHMLTGLEPMALRESEKFAFYKDTFSSSVRDGSGEAET